MQSNPPPDSPSPDCDLLQKINELEKQLTALRESLSSMQERVEHVGWLADNLEIAGEIIHQALRQAVIRTIQAGAFAAATWLMMHLGAR